MAVTTEEDVFAEATEELTRLYEEQEALPPREPTEQPEDPDDDPAEVTTEHESREGDEPEGEPTDEEPVEGDEPEPDESEEGQPQGTDPIDVSEDATVRLPDGRVVKVKDGLLMQADYTRKTQELADLRREAEAEREQVVAALDEVREWYQENMADPAGWATELIAESPDPTQAVAQAILALNEQNLLSDQFREAFNLEPVERSFQQDATARKIAELEAKLEERDRTDAQRAEVQRALAAYEQTWTQIKAEEGLTFESPQAEAKAKAELVKFAREREITDLEAAYAALAYQRSKSAPDTRANARKVTERKRRTAAVTPRSRGGAPQPRDPADLDAIIRESMETLDASLEP